VNKIWEIELQDGTKINSLPNIAETGMKHFKNLFRELDEENIG